MIGLFCFAAADTSVSNCKDDASQGRLPVTAGLAPSHPSHQLIASRPAVLNSPPQLGLLIIQQNPVFRRKRPPQ